MSRNALIIERTAPQTLAPMQLKPARSHAEYKDLIRLALRSHSVLAVVGASSGSRAAEACRGIASELGPSGKRVVIVQAECLMGTWPVLAAAGCLPTGTPNVWIWDGALDGSVEFFPRAIKMAAESEWLGDLRQEFDAVLLDCSAPEVAGVAEFAAKADAAVLVVEAGRTTKQQTQREQRALDLAGVKLAGCILMRRR